MIKINVVVCTKYGTTKETLASVGLAPKCKSHPQEKLAEVDICFLQPSLKTALQITATTQHS